MKNSVFTYTHLGDKGFTFSHPSISFTYRPQKNHNLVVDIHCLTPTRFIGGVNVNSAFTGASIASMYSLDDTLAQRLTLDDVQRDRGLYKLLKQFEKNCEGDISTMGFGVSNQLLRELLVSSNFYSAYNSWFKEEVFPKLSSKEKRHYNEIIL